MSNLSSHEQYVVLYKGTDKIYIGPYNSMAPITKKLNSNVERAKLNGISNGIIHRYLGNGKVAHLGLDEFEICKISWNPKIESNETVKEFYDKRNKAEKVKKLKSARYQGRRKLAEEKRARRIWD